MTPGISDNLFARDEAVPMTKEEVRALTLCRARLLPGQVLWDVGAGTGSLSVEAGRLLAGGQVFAVEQKEAALALLRENCRLFGVDNVVVVHGRAPDVLYGLPAPDRVLIGGSGGNLADILELCAEKLRPGGLLVLNVILPSSLHIALERLSGPPFSALSGLQLQAARLETLGSERYFKAQNPVWIISAQKEAS